ncbi:MAG: DUF4159 domain-containing protein [Salinivirgaceae bacterium]|nr:DUF4159 domain-containing protein [Salinivirgaceae bacterium]
MSNTKYIFCLLFWLSLLSLTATAQGTRIGLLKYQGGGDWYANPTSLPNLIAFCNSNIGSNINEAPVTVEVGSKELFGLPMVHMTGHGNVFFNEHEVNNLRQYLSGGGFLHIDDNYGIDAFVRREMKKVFPDKDFVELPLNHEIYNMIYPFPNGLPKIHEHDNKAPQGFGLFVDGRLVCFYTYECDLGDGWESASVHNDSEQIRTQALKMGANIVTYVFSH